VSERKVKTDLEAIATRIFIVRGQRVLLDSDLAQLYGVRTERLNQQVRRNRKRFPDEFSFQVGKQELNDLILQFARSSWGGRRKLPLVFTEHGAIMAASVLNSPRAVEMSVYVVRAFVKLRELLASNADLARKLAALEESLESLDEKTRKQFEEIYAAIRALMKPATPTSRPIGFTADITGKTGGQGRRRVRSSRPF
jgi:DnaJ-domain-containing protein 1